MHNYYIDNQELVPCQLRRLGRSKVRAASLVKVLSDGKVFDTQGPNCRETLHRTLPRAKQHLFVKGEKKPEGAPAPEMSFLCQLWKHY